MDRQISVGIRKKRFRRHRSEAIASIYWRSGVARAAATEMLSFVTLLLAASAVSASVIQGRPERKLADANFAQQQKKVLDIYVGANHNIQSNQEASNYDISANFGSFTDEKYPKEFLRAYNRGFLPKNGVFSLFCGHTRADAIKLFDLFYFAKDFDTFIKVANWAKAHINPGMFVYAYTLALTHRSDTQSFAIPPFYEIFPNLFAPADTLHQIYDDKMAGITEGRYSYNNTGYEYNYHSNMFGGLFSGENRGYGDFRISYFREDVGLNNYMALVIFRRPQWMCQEKYKSSPWLQRRGENSYQIFQQLLARYSLERTANGLPNVEFLKWNQPIRVGYTPRVTYSNGQSFYNRPDNVIPEFFNTHSVVRTKTLERRVSDAIDARALWEVANQTLLSLKNEDGFDLLGKIYFGAVDMPSGNYFRSAYYSGLEALAYVTSTASDRSYVGNALSTPFTVLRDPLYYNYLARFINLFFQHYKRAAEPYSDGEVSFNGVSVENVEVDKFVTYFDRFEYEVTNAVRLSKEADYKNHRYYARQYRLNHKPYNYNVTVKSSNAGDAIVRVFLGNKYDADEHELTFDQARLSFVEIDRFIVKLAAGVNVFERNSKESPIFVGDWDSFRTLYNNVQSSINQQTPFYVSENGQCGLPERLQLPMGWRGGRPVQLAVIVNNYDHSSAHPENNKYDIACGGAALYDGRPVGFPFDRPVHFDAHHVPNFYSKEVHIHHRDQHEVNRPASS